MKLSIALFLLAFLSHFLLVAQKPKDYGIKSSKALNFYLSGSKQIEYRDHLKAMEYLAQAIAIEPEFTDAHFLFTYAAHLKGKLQLAEASLLHLSKQNIPKYYGARFWYAEFLMEKARYTEAHVWYGRFMQTNPEDTKDRAKAVVNMRKAKYAAEAIKKPVPFKPENMGPGINSQGDEYMPNLTADGQTLFFTSRRPGNMGGFNPRLNDFGEDFYFSEWKNGKWSEVKNLGPPINTVDNEGAACFSQDGMQVYFTGCNRPDGVGECDIYTSKFNGKEWSEPVNMGLGINTPGYETQPWLSHDGNTLYFISTRKGGMGGTDIWYSKRMGNTWLEPENLGAPINTPGNEYSPMLHASDAVLYFSSDYHDGFGGMDIFYVAKTEQGWGEIKNMGYPVNTPGHERFIFVSSDGKRAYFSSDQIEGGYGRNDLYSFEIAPALRPPEAKYVKGIVRDSITQKPISATIMFVSLSTGDTIRKVESDPNYGRFLLSLPMNESYAAYVEEPGYLFYSGNFSLEERIVEENYTLDIALNPVKEGQSLVLRNIFFATASYELLDASHTELNKVLELMRKNPGIQVEIEGHTDSEGSEIYNLTLSQNRADAVKRYLVEADVSDSQIRSKGYGESKPVADNETEAGRAQNRRTEFRIIKLKP